MNYCMFQPTMCIIHRLAILKSIKSDYKSLHIKYSCENYLERLNTMKELSQSSLCELPVRSRNATYQLATFSKLDL